MYNISYSETIVPILLHKVYTFCKNQVHKKFEDSKEVIGSRKWKYRQQNSQKKKVKTTSNVSDVISNLYLAITGSIPLFVGY